uniref:hypothetical protein n=1 Tax=Agathobacter sp. TaxID=2021311 RepID=UPI004057A8F5
MQITERLIRNTNEQNKKKKQNLEENEEETLTYLKKQLQISINGDKGVFGQQVFEGINTRKSVFDQNALFHK